MIGSRPILFAAMLAGFAAAPGQAGTVTLETCAADRQALLEAIERNRKKSVREIEDQLAAEPTGDMYELLTAERDSMWDREESQRAMAQRIWRDCVAYVEPRRP